MKYFLLVLLIFNSCNTNFCSNFSGINVSEKLSQIKIDENKDYCTCLHEALEGNGESINEFSKFMVTKDLAYQHGIVLTKLIETIGDENYTSYLSDFSDRDKLVLMTYVSMGLYEMKLPPFQSEKLEDSFPKLDRFLIDE
ncbi:hypothetical protein [Aequorivita marina]|uniref:hypothetical protein n=1 Tax=Aequorivita marina TaxID=3073654 RepID=UPI002875DB5A|nr:hypothetical protein [Aequorivita sp. S2608]MDS1299682.1 hypothetical protein [Aequorivita sp. S2608]